MTIRRRPPPIDPEILKLKMPGMSIRMMATDSKVRPFRFIWEDAFMESNLPPTTRLVLFVLSTHMNAEGTCYPGTKTLLRNSGLSDRALRRNLDIAEAAGWLKRGPRGKGKGAGKDWNDTVYEAVIPDGAASGAGAYGAASSAGANSQLVNKSVSGTHGPALSAHGPALTQQSPI